jgi:hypothetical protein
MVEKIAPAGRVLSDRLYRRRDSMKLSDLKQPNDLSIQSYVDSLMDAIAKFDDLTAVVIVAQKPDGLSLVHNIENDAAIPDILSQFATQMRKAPISHSSREEQKLDS